MRMHMCVRASGYAHVRACVRLSVGRGWAWGQAWQLPSFTASISKASPTFNVCVEGCVVKSGSGSGSGSGLGLGLGWYQTAVCAGVGAGEGGGVCVGVCVCGSSRSSTEERGYTGGRVGRWGWVRVSYHPRCTLRDERFTSPDQATGPDT